MVGAASASLTNQENTAPRAIIPAAARNAR
jgi:hypothetical protein